mmetsp:Transcript_15111/g.19925  ORF Transcript_15111/g.19925 Transcript_15111/m.19925 type:complete len:224 (-) Transcript_15111:283-954(-)
MNHLITVLLLTVLSLLLLCALRLLYCLPTRFLGHFSLRRKVYRKLNDTVKTMVVLGSGGHTSEMFRLIQNLERKRYFPLIFVVAATDHTSEKRLRRHSTSTPEKLAGSQFVYIPRSREVGQSWITSVWTTIVATLSAFWVVLKNRPDLLLCNGPGTCIPVAAACMFFNICIGHKTTVVFVESFCRVKTLSLSGKLMYPLADRFVVHWPELRVKFPKSEYLGHI